MRQQNITPLKIMQSTSTTYSIKRDRKVEPTALRHSTKTWIIAGLIELHYMVNTGRHNTQITRCISCQWSADQGQCIEILICGKFSHKCTSPSSNNKKQQQKRKINHQILCTFMVNCNSCVDNLRRQLGMSGWINIFKIYKHTNISLIWVFKSLFY